MAQYIGCVLRPSVLVETGVCPIDEEFGRAASAKGTITNYVAQNWGQHAHAASVKVEQLILKSRRPVPARMVTIVGKLFYYN